MKNFTLIAALFLCYSAYSQIGIGIPNPDQSAVLELSSTRQGFLPPRLTTAQRDAISQPAVGLTIFNSTKNCLEWYLDTGWYNACGNNGVANITKYNCSGNKTGTMTAGKRITGVTQTITVTTSSIGHYNITSAANGITFSARGNFTSIGNHDIVLQATGVPLKDGKHNFTLIATTNTCTFERVVTDPNFVIGAAGRIWMAYNLGATAPATSATDAAQYGDYYQWGRATDGHEKINSATLVATSSKDTPGHNKFMTGSWDWRSPENDNLWQGAHGINNPCPSGFRIPTLAEWDEEFKASKITNTATLFNSPLNLTNSGYRHPISGSYRVINTESLYWASDIISYEPNVKHTNSNKSSHLKPWKTYGINVRCIKD